ncbi:hypothetical protein ALO95_200347 [Pseudomonas syringae pv. antirrhini]|uniref:Error-prone repair protein UmuD n=1 Tax=Pseudomonas syringae pv. actinidiae TaxID=103796 RepID=A0A2P0QFU6_PSESF|nr:MULTISPECIES: S24 family peptidase [Pseudomonas]ARO45273.1 Error-prone repair protein UmuD [Pseudomonas syringae pv. actinidiae]RMP38548.1 hypothetical protein ALQ24_200030 [Pseudomonas syringae pv. antirrhini]RMP41739.1 hypothetical protein ALQ23_200326 [Pseudomonas syringae pv. antirrhini]RMW24149.1 hypothetical protein ALO95_200347 [Pseudomonas syringae pv. antirrhini]WIN10120.1 S24 family peptidase [Pseudomonas syringae pv. antirrhini str. 126]
MNVASIRKLLPSAQKLPVISGCATGGFPNPAADYYEPPVSLDELLNTRAPHVWIVRLQGNSMEGAGLFSGSRLVVDRAVEALAGRIVLAYVDNQPLVKRLSGSPAGWVLESEHPDYKPVTPLEYEAMEVFGVVTWSITPHVG